VPSGPRSAVASRSRLLSERTRGPVRYSRWPRLAVVMTGRAMLIASKTLGRVTPHVNVAYEVADSNADLENFTYAVGFDARVSNRVTVALELLGRSNPHVDAIGNDVVDAAFAVKFNPFDRYNLPLNAFVSVPVNDDGLRSDAIWGLGFDLILN